MRFNINEKRLETNEIKGQNHESKRDKKLRYREQDES